MKIKEFLEMQKKLDKCILKNADIKEYPIINIQLALLVELGELANEVQSFKHWKKHKNVNRDRVIEEWADCFHFSLSLENEFNILTETTKGQMIQEIAKVVYKDVVNMDTNLCFLYAFQNIQEPLITVISLGLNLGIRPNEMEKAYLNKHKENYKRQQEGY